jgi:quinol monooxygenase YgiN
MSKISLIAKLTAAEGKADELDAALRSVVEAADEEDGLEVYSVHADTEDPNVFYFFELYQDQAALDVHGRGDRMKPAMKALGSMLAGRPEVTMLNPVAAKGLEL